jgi:hypothetical protein
MHIYCRIITLTLESGCFRDMDLPTNGLSGRSGPLLVYILTLIGGSGIAILTCKNTMTKQTFVP